MWTNEEVKALLSITDIKIDNRNIIIASNQSAFLLSQAIKKIAEAQHLPFPKITVRDSTIVIEIADASLSSPDQYKNFLMVYIQGCKDMRDTFLNGLFLPVKEKFDEIFATGIFNKRTKKTIVSNLDDSDSDTDTEVKIKRARANPTFINSAREYIQFLLNITTCSFNPGTKQLNLTISSNNQRKIAPIVNSVFNKKMIIKKNEGEEVTFILSPMPDHWLRLIKENDNDTQLDQKLVLLITCLYILQKFSKTKGIWVNLDKKIELFYNEMENKKIFEEILKKSGIFNTHFTTESCLIISITDFLKIESKEEKRQRIICFLEKIKSIGEENKNYGKIYEKGKERLRQEAQAIIHVDNQRPDCFATKASISPVSSLEKGPEKEIDVDSDNEKLVENRPQKRCKKNPPHLGLNGIIQIEENRSSLSADESSTINTPLVFQP